MESKDNDLGAAARQGVRMKLEFLEHLATPLLINAAVLAIWALAGAGYPWFVWPLVLSGFALAFHGVGVLLSLSRTSAYGLDHETRATERGLQPLQERQIGR